MKRKEQQLLDKPIKDIMSTEVKVASIKNQVSDLCRMFWKENINHIPITSEDGKVIGMFSMTDAMKVFQEQIYNRPILSREDINEIIELPEVISSKVIYTIEGKDSVFLAKQMMHKAGINSLLVYNGLQLVGIITSKDLERLGIAVDNDEQPISSIL